MLVYAGTKSSGSFSVNHPNLRKMGNIGIIQIFIQLRNRLIYSQTQQVDFRRDRSRFGNFDSAA